MFWKVKPSYLVRILIRTETFISVFVYYQSTPNASGDYTGRWKYWNFENDGGGWAIEVDDLSDN